MPSFNFYPKIKTLCYTLSLIGLSLTLNFCAGAPSEFHSLLGQQPKLVQVSPTPESIIEETPEFFLEFSERLAIKTIHESSVTLIQGPLDPELLNDTDELIQAIEKEELTLINCHYVLTANEQKLNLAPESPLNDGLYYLVITPHLRSTAGLPFNDQPGDTPKAFLAPYALGEAAQLLPAAGGEIVPNYGAKTETLVINEVLYDGRVSDSDGESFIELYGSPNADISDYYLILINGANGESTDHIDLPLGSTLDEHGLFVIADLRTNSSTTTQVAIFDYLDQFDPQNGPDAIQLFDRDDELLDTLSYGTGGVMQSFEGLPLVETQPATDVGGGVSLSRLLGQDTDDNSLDFFALETPTPGVL